MGGVDVGGGGGGKRKSLDSEISMIPMIDLLMVTISFLLITAVWTHMSRLEADADMPGTDPSPCGGCAAPPRCGGGTAPPVRALHVDMRAPDRFVLQWKLGATPFGEPIDVPRRAERR